MSFTKEVFDRTILKTAEGELLYELQNSYELSPRLSEQIIITAKNCLLKSKNLRHGQIEAHVVAIDEKSGKPLDEMSKTQVVLTLTNDIEDQQILLKFGRVKLRQIKIQRLTEEALEQNGVLSQEDLSMLLNVDTRTIKRDIAVIRGMGVDVITRGVFHNIGRGQTHKVKIISLYLEGNTFSEIKQRTRHSISAIKRYLESFGKVVMSLEYGISDPEEIKSVTGFSKYLVDQYISIINTAMQDPTKRYALEMLKKRLSYQYGSKKTIMSDGLRAEVTTGGCK
jgi:hypothetical protein